MAKTKKTLLQSELDQDAALLATALKAAGFSSLKFSSGVTQPSDEQKIKALETHIETMKQHRYELSQEHGNDARSAVDHISTQISRAIELIAKLKIKATEPV